MALLNRSQKKSLCAHVAMSLATILLSSLTYAWPPTYGAEFEFSAPGLVQPNFDKIRASDSEEKKAQMRFVERMRERCQAAGCQVIEKRGKFDKDYTVQFEDGWWFKISYDPSCVEITFKPTTLEELEAKKKLINEQIFGTAAELGFSVESTSTAHFNIGIRSLFDDSGTEFMKFYADYANHPELTLGSLGSNLYNAPPLSVMGQDQRDALTAIVARVNAGELTTIQQIAREIQSKVYIRSYDVSWGGFDHYQAFGLKYVNRADLTRADAPMELRAVWAQKSAEQFNLVAKLIEAREQYLRTVKTPIVYHASETKTFSNAQMRSRFFVYVAETGRDYYDFEPLLPYGVKRAPLAGFARANATAAEQLTSFLNYEDLIETSPWIQKRIVNLLARDEVRDLPEAETLRAFLKTKSDERIAKDATTEAVRMAAGADPAAGIVSLNDRGDAAFASNSSQGGLTAGAQPPLSRRARMKRFFDWFLFGEWEEQVSPESAKVIEAEAVVAALPEPKNVFDKLLIDVDVRRLALAKHGASLSCAMIFSDL